MDHKVNKSTSYVNERIDLAASLRWTVRLDMHEAVANHFSLVVGENGNQFLMNPNQMHFSRVKASDLLLLDSKNPNTLTLPNAPDPTAWALHGAIHRNCPHARCAMHVHSTYATVLATLKDSNLPPLDQTSAMFFNRVVVDTDYGGLAFGSEGERCSHLFSDPAKKVMIMGNHGIFVIGNSVADTFNRLFYFERAAKTYILALQTGKPLRILSDDVAERVAKQVENYPDQVKHFEELKAILEFEKSDYNQ